ncbi:hypothetical protein PG988_011683 [Apiospora saccharicola]
MATGATGIPVIISWLQAFGLMDWGLGFLRRWCLASRKFRAFARAVRLWEQAEIDAAGAVENAAEAQTRANEFAACAEETASLAEEIAETCPAAGPFARLASALPKVSAPVFSPRPPARPRLAPATSSG